MMEECWNWVPTARPHAVDILSLLETASNDWISPTSEVIASLSLGRPTGRNHSMTGLADTIPDAVPGTIGVVL